MGRLRDLLGGNAPAPAAPAPKVEAAPAPEPVAAPPAEEVSATPEETPVASGDSPLAAG